MCYCRAATANRAANSAHGSARHWRHLTLLLSLAYLAHNWDFFLSLISSIDGRRLQCVQGTLSPISAIAKSSPNFNTITMPQYLNLILLFQLPCRRKDLLPPKYVPYERICLFHPGARAPQRSLAPSNCSFMTPGFKPVAMGPILTKSMARVQRS